MPATKRCDESGGGLSLIGLACCLLTLGACGTGDFDNENDRLRRLTLEQASQIKALQAQRDELTSRLAESERSRQTALDPDVLAAIPSCAGISLESLSGLQRPREGEPAGAKIVAYLDPFDGRQRFVQIVGGISVDAIIAGPTGVAAPMMVSITLGPAQVRDAYRTSITGSYYLVEIPVDNGTLPAEGTVTIRARFVDALSGLTHEAESTSRIRP